jgi:dephospho-CoA kinase
MILKVGLTGGLASGKSTIAEGLEKRGIPVRDADRMVHELYAPGAPGARAVAAAFGPGFLSPDGSVDRRTLSTHVFHDRAALSRLNDLIHPLVRDEQSRWFASLAEKGEPLGVIEATLLVETGGRERFDVLVAVSAPAEMRLKRAIKRSGEIDPNEFVKRMTAQFSDAAREEVSDIVVRTDGTREELEEKIDRLAEDLRARAADAGAGGRSGFFRKPGEAPR